jgi:hypothetical protein
MTTPHSSPTDTQPTHDFVLNDGTNVYGFQFSGNPQTGYQESPLSGGSKIFKIIQSSWLGGRGKKDYQVDNTGFLDSINAWTMTDQAIHPTIMMKPAKGIRSFDSIEWGTGPNLEQETLNGGVPPFYIAQSFVASATYTAKNLFFWMRQQSSTTPLYLYICSDTAGKPNVGAPLASVVYDQNIPSDGVSLRKATFSSGASLNSGTTYWVVFYQQSWAGYYTNYLGLSTVYSTGYSTSTDGSNWTATGGGIVAVPFRLTDTDISRTFYPFYLWGAYHIVSKNDDGSAPAMYVNGDLALATVGLCGASTIGTTGKTWGTTKFVGARVRIVDGTGSGQNRIIASHTDTTLTISVPWTVNPDGTSIYCIYSTDWWTLISGHGLTNITNPPVVSKNFVWFPQGKFAFDRRMTFTSGAYSFTTDGSNQKNILLGIHTMADGTKRVIGVKYDDHDLRFATIPSTFGDLSWGANKGVGEYGYKPNGFVTYNGVGYLFKENTVYKIVNGVISEFVFGGMADSPFSSNGAYLAVQNLWLYFTRANSVVQMQGDNATDIENFKTGYEPLNSNYRGPGGVSSAEGWLFRWIDAGASGYSTVMAWNGFGWHNVSARCLGERITNVFWQPCPDYMSRLWTVVAGDLIYQEFPEYGSVPTKDSNCKFEPYCSINTAIFNIGDKDFYKYFNGLVLSIHGTGKVRVFFQYDNGIGDNALWTEVINGVVAPDGRIYIQTADSRSVLTTIGMGSIKQIRFKILIYSSNIISSPVVVESLSTQGSEIEPLKYQWAMTCAVESDGEDQQGNADTSPDVLQLALQNWANTRTQLLVSSTKSSLNGKYVLVEPPTIRMQSIETEDGSSKWKGTLWFTLRET